MPCINICRSSQWLILTLLLLFFVVPVARAADDSPQRGDSVQVMEAFERQTSRVEDANVLNDHKKHVVMFLMGVPLIILVLITGALGIAMVVYGKHVFVMHMVFAGLTVTLAIAHVIVGMVWFYPF
jgi:hypothetical protein